MKHLCGPCGKGFDSEEEYLGHACEKAEGAKPTTPEYLIKTTTKHFARISESSQKRGKLEKEKKEKKKVQ